jgi:hypothetical protein
MVMSLTARISELADHVAALEDSWLELSEQAEP